MKIDDHGFHRIVVDPEVVVVLLGGNRSSADCGCASSALASIAIVILSSSLSDFDHQLALTI